MRQYKCVDCGYKGPIGFIPIEEIPPQSLTTYCGYCEQHYCDDCQEFHKGGVCIS